MSSFPIFNSFQRIGNFPLTDTEVFDTIEDLQNYVNNNPTAYSGQQCVVKGSTPKAYIISISNELHEQAKQTDVDNKVDKIISKGLLPLKYVEIQYVEGEGVIPFSTLDDCNKFFNTTFINGIIDKTNNIVYLYTDTGFLLTDRLFKDNISIVSFKSDAVSSTKSGVFEGCTNLETVELLEIDTLQENMFYRCASLSILLIPKVKYINATYDVCFKDVSSLSIFKIHISTKYENSGEPHQLLIDILLNNSGCSIEYTILNFPDDIPSFIGSLEESEVFSLTELGESFELLIRDKGKNVGYKMNLLNLSQTLGINSVYLSSIINKTINSLEVNDSIIVSINKEGNTELKTITYSQLVSILQAYFDTQYNNYTLTKQKIEDVLTGNITTHTHNQYIDKTEEFIIDPYNIVWVGDWIKVTHGYWIRFQGRNYYGFVNAVVETGAGHINIRCKIRRPERSNEQVFNGLYWETTESFNGFYLKDLDNVLTPETDFARIILKIKVEQPGGTSNGADVDGDSYKWDAPNVIVDDTLLDGVQHGTWMKNTYLWAYNREAGEAFSGDVILTENDASLHEPNFESAGILNTHLYSNYCRTNGANLIMEAFQNRLELLSANGNPDIMTFVCHYSNSKQEWNYTRPMYGIQDDSVFGTLHVFPVNTIACGAGNPLDTDNAWQTSYGEGVEFIEPTLQSDLIGLNVGGGATSWNNVHQQSPATAIIAAKFRYIKDQTGVSWNTVRLACRATASQNGVWNKYRGFGVINTSDAIEWINNLKLLFKTAAKERFEEGRGYPSFMDNIENYTDNTPLPKKLTLSKPIGNYADNAAALTAGLQIGDCYHTDGIIKIVI